MRFSVEYSERARKSLEKIGRPARVMIRAWIEKKLEGTDDPRRRGKGLAANRKGQWRYRVGD